MRRPPKPLLAVLGGLCLAAATPPWGFWPFAFAGLVVADHVLVDARGLARFGYAWTVWVSLLLPSLLWMQDLTAPGYVIACVAYAGFLAAGMLLAPPGAGRYVGYAGGIILAEWVRWRWPFGGVPLSNLATGQVAGPLAPLLRLGGALFVVGMTVIVAGALAAAVKRHVGMASALGAFSVLVLLVAVEAPAGSGTGEYVEVALVQGGGPQGTRASETEPGVVFERHLVATEDVDPGIDLLLWPEDVVDVPTLTGSPEEARLQQVARRFDAVFVAGVVEDEGTDRFRNWAVAYGPDGAEIDRYEKVERVPFGEWVPLRDLLESVAGDALPDRDATVGTAPAVVDTPLGRLGVSISWEIFFGERARDAVNHGGRVIVNPTNGASFRGTQVQTQQVANSRMRAIENGRWVAQIAPTGFTAVVAPDGDVLQRTDVSDREILHDTIELRTGRTIYTRVGDALALGFAALCLVAGWALELGQRSRLEDHRGGAVVDQ